MFVIAYIFFGFFVVYDILFCCAMGYSAIVEEWFCPNRIPEFYESIVLQCKIKYQKIRGEETDDYMETELNETSFYDSDDDITVNFGNHHIEV
jgi:hypothetical protein